MTTTLSTTIVESLKSTGETLSIAESLTGGALTSEIVSVPGASHILKGSIVAYSVEIKVHELSVSQDIIDKVGVVSEEVALAMADGVKARMNSTWSIASTGVRWPRSPSRNSRRHRLVGDRWTRYPRNSEISPRR